MAIDYIVQYPCAVRKQVNDQQLLELIKHRNRALAAIAAVQQQFPQKTPQQIAQEHKMAVIVAGPDGKAQQAAIPIIQVWQQSAPLDALQPHCQNCPANVFKRPFGCTEAVNYPIARATENWLLERLPADIKNPSLDMLLRFMADTGVDGAAVDAQRGRREIYESSQPLTRQWGGLFRKKIISSSQLLQIMFFAGQRLEPKVNALFCQLLGYTKSENAGSNKGIADMRLYMNAALVAVELKANLLFDA